MSTIDITRHINKDLEKVIFEKSKKDNQLKERDNYKPYKSDFTEEEWWYFIHTLHDAYIAGANRVVNELNRQSDAEALRAQKSAEKRIQILIERDNIKNRRK